MTVTPVPGVTYYYDNLKRALVSPGRPDLPLPATNRTQLVAGNYLPGPDTTGALTPYNELELLPPGNISLQGGQALEGKIVQGVIYLNSANNTIRNCWVIGQPASTLPGGHTSALIQGNYNTSTGNIVEDVTVRPQTPNMYVTGIMGRGLTIRRCDVSGCVDPVGVTRGTGARADVIITGSWLHDGLYYRPCPTTIQSDGQTHSDIIQWHGGYGLTILGCRLEGFSSSPDANRPDDGQGGGAPFYPKPLMLSTLMINGQSGAPTGELVCERNWLDGGFVTINARQDANCLSGGAFTSRIRFNRFGSTVGYMSPLPNLLATLTGKQIDFSDNVAWDKSAPLAVGGEARDYRVNV